MNIKWNIENSDIKKIKDFVNKNDNPFVRTRRERNVYRQNITLDNDSIIKGMVMCLLTSQQRSGPNTPVGQFLRLNPFPLTFDKISEHSDVEYFLKNVLLNSGLNRFITKISYSFSHNFELIHSKDWEIIDMLSNRLNGNQNKLIEREIADYINDLFKGFGPKQSRNLLQALGLTKYEIPIDSRITNWLNDFGFPVPLRSLPLQDKGYYHFVSDGIQYLCKEADIYPCILDAAIFSSFDKGEWTDVNIVY